MGYTWYPTDTSIYPAQHYVEMETQSLVEIHIHSKNKQTFKTHQLSNPKYCCLRSSLSLTLWTLQWEEQERMFK